MAEQEEELTEIRLKQMRNLKMFKDKSDDDIREFWKNRKPKAAPIPVEEMGLDPDTQKRFKTKLNQIQKDIGVDLSNPNDVELLKSLVRHLIQLENVDQQIQQAWAEERIDTRSLKNLGDYQRTLMATVKDLQDTLAVGRKQRKADEVDDFPSFVAQLKEKAKSYWEKTTKPVMCGNCKVQLAQYWLNSPDTTEVIQFEIVCPKCDERVVFKK